VTAARRGRNGNTRIPRIIWQTFATGDLPAPAVACRDSWAAFNPDWEYRFLDDHDIDTFVREHSSAELHALFRSLPLGVMRADLWRYLAVWVFGGLYTDIDTVCLAPVDSWLPADSDLIITPENHVHLCQWTFLAAPGHPCLEKVLDLIVTRARPGIDTSRDEFVHYHTGPGVWTDAILQATGCSERNMINLSRLRRPPCLRRTKVRLLGWKYFREWKVRHLYGSRAWGGDYGSWTRARDCLLGKTEDGVE